MRMMMKGQMEIAGGNRSVQDRSLPKLIQEFVQKHKPEASYFLPESRTRTAYFLQEFKDVSHIPALVEPWWMTANAKVEVTPAMYLDELGRGIESFSKKVK